jgi:hypothetical protein
MVEWLKSDIVYLEKKIPTKSSSENNKSVKTEFLQFIEKRFNPIALYYHYKSMCKQNYLKYLKSGDNRTYKKYLYAMRGLVNALWAVEKETIPPLDFNKTIDLIDSIPELIVSKLKEIIKLKKDGFEGTEVSRDRLFEDYIESFLKKNHDVKNIKILDSDILQRYIWQLFELKNG